MKQTCIATNGRSRTGKAAQNLWFTPEITAMMDKIVNGKWFVREVIYPKEVKGCEIFDYNGCMRLYHNADRFFALDGERLNTEAGKYCNLNVDFFSAEKIIIQQRDEAAFDHWCNSDPFELTSLWPERQLVIAARHDTKQLIAFAPIFVAYTPEFHLTGDMRKSFNFELEFNIYRSRTEKRLGQETSSESLSFLKNSHSLLLWLKNHCY